MKMPQFLRELLPAEPDAGQDFGPDGARCACGAPKPSRIVSLAAVQRPKLFLGRYPQPSMTGKDVVNGGIATERRMPAVGNPGRPASDRARIAQSGTQIDTRQIDTIALITGRKGDTKDAGPWQSTYDIL